LCYSNRRERESHREIERERERAEELLQGENKEERKNGNE
jgi:hypothetical protein